jgi:virulence-associated protein VagC
MTLEYEFAGAERGKFFRKRARSVFPRTAKAKVVIDRHGYPILLLPEEFRIDATEMRVSRYGKRIILSAIKKKRAPVHFRRHSTKGFREMARTCPKRDPGSRALIGVYAPLMARKKKKRSARRT